MALPEATTMNFSEAAAVVERLIREGFPFPIYLEGAPGIGKSALAHLVVQRLGRPSRVFRPAYLDRTDVAGTVVPVNGVPRLVQIADVLPFDEPPGGVLIIEELPQAPHDLHGCLLELLLERRVNRRPLPANWAIIALGNRREDNAGANAMLTTVRSRVLTVQFQTELDEWLDWARGVDLTPVVTTFLHQCPDELYKFTGEEEEAFPCHRTWEVAAHAIARLGERNEFSNRIRLGAIAGAVGVEAATKLLGFWELFGKLPDGRRVWEGTEKVPQDAAVQYAAVAVVVAGARHFSRSALDRSLKSVLTQFAEELQAVIVKELIGRDKELANYRNFTEFFARLSKPIREALKNK